MNLFANIIIYLEAASVSTFHICKKRLFQWMRDNGYLMKAGASYNLPTQYSMERGWMEIKESSISNPDGSVRVTKTTKITGKGQTYFVNALLVANQLQA